MLLLAVIDGDEIVYRDYVDISIAVATPKVSTTVYTAQLFLLCLYILVKWPLLCIYAAYMLHAGPGCACLEECGQAELCRL
jgi:hypothetical protein